LKGLILGAVAKELFPQLNSDSQLDKLVGISVGFFAGLFFVNFLDYVVEWFENKCNESVTSEDDPEKMNIELTGSMSYQSLNDFEEDSVDMESGSSKKGSPNGSFRGSPKGKGSPTGSARKHSHSMDDETDPDAPVLQLASQAIASPTHRDKIRKKVSELVKSIDNIEEKSNFLLISGRSGSQGQSLSDLNEETYADQIDEEIHKLQYNLDHCRRLIQGSESNIVGVVPRLWITESGKLSLRDGIVDLKQGAASLVRFLTQDKHDTESLVEIHRNMAEMDHQITHLHETVEEYSFKWGRRHKRALIIIPQAGSQIPLGLIIPVTVDCIVDGFLVGTTCSISHQAGFILAMANCIEMGFLGLAVSMRIRNCTASSVWARYAALIVPPFIMFLSSVMGAFVGAAARSQPMVYIGFISFGVVALLYLVVNELLVEARESLAGNERWWTGMVIFIGIYLVLILDMFLG
jgi:zinc transporter ZupT